MRYNILIVDDVALNRKLMKSVLEKYVEPATFYDAEDGFKALDCIARRDIDLIILDLMMPGKDGFEVLQELKIQEHYKEIPVIVNSALDGIDSIQKALSMGANEYFTKPLTLDQMEIILPLKVMNVLKSYDHKKELMRINEKMNEQIKLARIFQDSLIAQANQIQNIDIVGKYIPCSELSGDFYDVIQVKQRTWFIMADISSDGITAAMVSSMVKVLFYHCIHEFTKPHEVLQEMNRYFCDVFNGQFVFTAFIGVLEEQNLSYSNAGHPYPIIIHMDGTNDMIHKNYGALGVSKEALYKTNELILSMDDIVMMYTDGIFTQIANKPIHHERAKTLYEFSTYENPSQIVDMVTEALLSDGEQRFHDDVSIMTIRLKHVQIS